ncbi:MAG: SAM-dependent methyltransferase [Gammaproteobacteria bacterium]|jgi:SAM-dependent methyltransferase|nr:SAM-dependent methyltransferase [Gammaproteobacteria bacterium]MDP6094835.1 class I SAM-dependent methyltransferase [Gammaproteobacteria bacterium]MDP7089231.1 class I SAM-dependent methyltransferase [Dehalococcoidia bacterium]HJN97281.1 class I SAM-dependent methyltransferase [Gammaproteobacteria bacterium]|tara:strand:- start:4168 stop:5391 length:1224 start_codon:yes stop_codon:yes gene_type:complete
MKCRHCGTPLAHTFLDLGFAPPSNAYLSAGDLHKPEVYYPLKIKVCDQCWLVQTEDYAEAGALFTPEYAYFSSTSSSWLEHARLYAEKMVKELALNKDSFVIEVASNDGYLLKNFVAAGIPCLGIEPTDSTADAAELIGVPVLRKFFGEDLGKQLAADGKQADLIAGNNVYAHVPDINDFTRGLKAALKPGGVITLEFPHLMQLLEHTQFDTVYHEHFSYISLHTVNRIVAMADLRLFDVEQLPTHGGSLRIYGCHADDARATTKSVQALLNEEERRRLRQLDTYLSFQPRADKIKNDLLAFLIEQKRAGTKVVAYGAAAKGNTLLNYGGIKPDLLWVVFDAATAKQNKFMPGSHIPILPPEKIAEVKPDYILILPWNIAEEVRQQNKEFEKCGSKFVKAVPELTIL